MSDRRRGLGRGLGALIPTEPTALSAMTRPRDVFFADTGVERTAPRIGQIDTPAARSAGVGTDSGAVSRETGAFGVRPDSTQLSSSETTDGIGARTDIASEVSRHEAEQAVSPKVSDRAAGAEDDLAPVPGARYALLPIDAITPNARQPRQYFDEDDLAELVHSIREIGVLQPVVVRPVAPAGAGASAAAADHDGQESADATGEAPAYELVMGERRWRASRQAGETTIPAIIKDTSDDAMLRDALLENLHRSQLNPLEEAAAYQQLLEDFGCTHEELAGRLGRSRPQISNVVRLLKLPPLVQRRVAAGVLSAGHARALLGLPDAAAMERLAQRIVAEGLSVRSVEEIVALGGDAERPQRAARRPDERMPELDDLAAFLADRWETRVSIAMGRHKGRLTVEFASVDDLNRILEAIGEKPVDGADQALAG